MDRSASISHREDDLACSLIISVIDGAAASIPATIARQFEVDESLLRLLPFGPARFLLILPSSELMERIYNGGRPIITSTLRLHVMRWTRFLHSTAASLQCAVEIDLLGIPAHAWELSSAEQLLNDHCWISGVHPATADRRDCFRVSAWCSDPALIPSEMTPEIVEPTTTAGGAHPEKRTLS